MRFPLWRRPQTPNPRPQPPDGRATPRPPTIARIEHLHRANVGLEIHQLEGDRDVPSLLSIGGVRVAQGSRVFSRRLVLPIVSPDSVVPVRPDGHGARIRRCVRIGIARDIVRLIPVRRDAGNLVVNRSQRRRIRSVIVLPARFLSEAH